MLRFLVSLLILIFTTTARSEVYSVVVHASRNESNKLTTTISVPQRALVSVHVTGVVSLGSGRTSTPNGILAGIRPKGMTFGAPVVVIRGNHYSIEGGSRSFVAPHSGTISLYIADTAVSDNTGSYTFSIQVDPQVESDADEDELPDEFEDQVLSYFAPSLRFDSTEDVWPSSVQWHARVSTIGFGTFFPDYEELISTGIVPPMFPEWHIALKTSNDATGTSNVLDRAGGLQFSTTASLFRVATDNTWRREGEGRPGPDSQGFPSRLIESGLTLGLYGRVAIGSAQGWESTSPDRLLVQFFHLSSYSAGGSFDLGEHEGDWEYLSLELEWNPQNPTAVLNPSAMRVVRWWAHGSRIQWNAAGEPDPSDENNAAYMSGNAGSKWFDYHELIECRNRLTDYPMMPVRNVPAFIQANGHGFFATRYDWGKRVANVCQTQGPANGDGLTGTPVQVANVGEINRPRLGMEMICQYVGRWGQEASEAEPPEGPILQSADGFRLWPRGKIEPPKQARYVGSWNHGRSVAPFGVLAPAGRISWPHITVDELVAAQDAPEGWRNTILLYPGIYRGTGVLAPEAGESTVLKATHGPAVLGD